MKIPFSLLEDSFSNPSIQTLELVMDWFSAWGLLEVLM